MKNEKPFGVFAVLGLGLLLLAVCQCQAGSIFDDDYVPPQRPEKPKADVPAVPHPQPEPTPPPPVVNPANVPPTPAPVPAETTSRRAVPTPAEQAACRKLFKEAFGDQLKDKSTSGRRKLTGVLMTEAAKTAGTPIDRWFYDGRRYTMTIKVRKTAVEAYLNERLITSWKTDYSDLASRAWGIPLQNGVGIATGNVDIRVDLAEIIEVTGQGAQISK